MSFDGIDTPMAPVTPPSDRKRRASPSTDVESQDQSAFKKLKGDIFTNPSQQQLVPLISRAETAAVKQEAQLQDANTGGYDSDDDQFEDAKEEIPSDDFVFAANADFSNFDFSTMADGNGQFMDMPTGAYGGGVGDNSNTDFMMPGMQPFDSNSIKQDFEDIGIPEPDAGEQSVPDLPSDARDDPDDDEDETQSNSSYPDLHKEAFGIKDDDEESIVSIDDPIQKALNNQLNGFNPDEHTQGCNSQRRVSTPPPPRSTASSGPKKATSSFPIPKINTKEEGRRRPGPDVDRDLSTSLRAHFNFHQRVLHLIPRLQNQDFDWSRRYWIAILISGKKPKNATNEKDFVWMKGNKYSTVKTVWHKYVDTTMADPETTVLMLGHERATFEEQMQECDFFGDRFVLFRAVEKGTEEAEAKSVVDGVVPRFTEVVEID